MSVYNFTDFLPLDQRKAGWIYQGGLPSALWVVKPFATTLAKVQFRRPSDPTVGKSDIWDKRPSGPHQIPFWYLKSHHLRRHIDPDDHSQGTEDFEFLLEQDKCIFHRYIGGKWYVKDVSEPGTIGIPYFRQSWRIQDELLHIVENWYYILNHIGQRKRRIYHRQEFIQVVGATIAGPEWTGAAPLEKEYIQLSEAYWERNLDTGESKWLFGDGSVDGEPNGEDVVYGRTRHHAKDGIMAYKSDAGGRVSGTKTVWPF